MSYLHPIAPLLEDDQSMSRTDPYAASCNPPRQAKRPRTVSQTSASLSPSIGPTSRGQIKSGRSTEQSSSSTAPPAAVNDDAVAKRRGRKSTSSRAARETQRKMNHSIIEKARRTKINDALATLRALVPVQHKRNDEVEDNEHDLTENGGKAGEEKEFKLDVLVRTVSFLQELTERVKLLEQGQGVCASCKKGSGTKRPRNETENPEHVMDDPEEGPSLRVVRQRSSQTSPPESCTRLPSIASWLPNPILDPNPSLLRKPSPHGGTEVGPKQLPSPPSSTQFGPSIATRIPPAFALPLASQSHPASTNTSPLLSPIHTPEDESAASMLLQMGVSSRRSFSASELSPVNTGGSRRDPSGLQSGIQPWTPSSMLGLTKI